MLRRWTSLDLKEREGLRTQATFWTSRLDRSGRRAVVEDKTERDLARAYNINVRGVREVLKRHD